MHYKTIEAEVKSAGMPMHILNAVYATELNKDKSPLTAVLLEPLDPERIPSFREELKYVLKSTNGRRANDLMLNQGDKTLLLLACDRDHVEEIFDGYLSALGGQGFALAGFMHEYVPSPLPADECKNARSFIRSRSDRFYNELTSGLDAIKRRASAYVASRLETLTNEPAYQK